MRALALGCCGTRKLRKEHEMGQEVIQYLPVDRIECEPQIREEFPEQKVVGMARSFQEVGQQQAVRVRQDGERLVMVDGELRLRAARLAKLPRIAVIVEEKQLCEAEVLQRQIVANMQRADLSPCERARALQRLIEATGWQVKQAAEKCGLSNGTATKLLAVLNLPEAIRKQVNAGEIPMSGAYELARVADPVKQAELAEQVAEGHLTRDALSGAVKSEANGNGEKPSSQLKRITAALGEGETVSVAGPALTLERVIAVCEELLAKARRARTRGVDLKQFAKLVRKEALASAS